MEGYKEFIESRISDLGCPPPAPGQPKPSNPDPILFPVLEKPGSTTNRPSGPTTVPTPATSPAQVPATSPAQQPRPVAPPGPLDYTLPWYFSNDPNYDWAVDTGGIVAGGAVVVGAVATAPVWIPANAGAVTAAAGSVVAFAEGVTVYVGGSIAARLLTWSFR